MIEDFASFEEVQSLHDRLVEITSEVSLMTIICMVMVCFLVFWPKGSGKKNES